MKVYVTGARGFVGSFLAGELARAGHVLAAGVAGAQAVVHLAAIAHRRASPVELDEVNVRLAERVAREAAAAGAHFVFLSSVKVHGEESTAPFDERSPIAPQDVYGQSKARAEEALRGISGLSMSVLRPPLVYGPRVKANFLALMDAIARGWPLPLGSIDNRRSLIYVGNLADVVIRCLNAQGTFLVSDGPAVSTPQLCRELGQALQRPARLFHFPPALLPRKLAASLEVDDSAMRRALGWRPPFTRQAALAETATWHASRGQRQAA
jgi:nucleoside-diphosphate-sugar epimerase